MMLVVFILICSGVCRRVRSGSGVGTTSIHPTDQRVQEESADEEEKETDKKLPGHHLSYQAHVFCGLLHIHLEHNIIKLI